MSAADRPPPVFVRVALDPDLREWLEDHAKRTRQTMARVTRRAIVEHLSSYEHKAYEKYRDRLRRAPGGVLK